MLNPKELKLKSFRDGSSEDMPIRWYAEYLYHDYWFKISTLFEKEYWSLKTCCIHGGVNIIASATTGYSLEPDELRKTLHREDVENYIEQLRDAKDIAEYIMANIEHLQKGEIVY